MKMAKTKPGAHGNALETAAIATRIGSGAIQFNHMLQSAEPSTVSSEIEQDIRIRPRVRTALALLSVARRFIVISAIAFWLGGFTFYAGVVVPTGVKVLGTHKAVGFITQEVTRWLNVAGVIALSIFLVNLLPGWRQSGRGLRRLLMITWMVMAAIEIELFILHPVMDRMLTTHPVREILDVDRFDNWHRVYLMSTTIQWFLGVVHVWGISLLWGKENAWGHGQGAANEAE
jgi:hypothetical protein